MVSTMEANVIHWSSVKTVSSYIGEEGLGACLVVRRSFDMSKGCNAGAVDATILAWSLTLDGIQETVQYYEKHKHSMNGVVPVSCGSSWESTDKRVT